MKSQAQPTSCEELFTIEPSRVYNAGDDETIFTFKITQTGAQNALSHWGFVFDVCEGTEQQFVDNAIAETSTSATGPWSTFTLSLGTDASQDCVTGTVLKFNQAMTETVRYFRLRLDGDVKIEIGVAYIKFGSQCCVQDLNFGSCCPTLTVDDPDDIEVCAGDKVSVDFTGSAETTFEWTNSNTSIGLAASGTGDIAEFTTTNTGNTPLVATITVTPTQGDCEGDAETFTITVNPLPVVDAGSYGPVCEDADPVALLGTPSGGIWSGTGVSGNATDGFFFDPSVGTQELTYTFTDGEGCSASDNVTITVDDKPNVDAGAYGPVCEDADPIALAGTPTGGTWTGTGVSGNTTDGFFFDPAAGTQTLTYTVTDGACTASDQVTITVDDKPTVEAGTYGPVCEDADPIALLGTPAGGTWTGTGVTGNTTDGFFFDPSSGTQTLTYTVTDGACTASDQVTITVDDKPNVDAGTYGPVCEDGDPIALLGTPAGGTWTGTGVTGNTTDGFFFDPSAGTQTLTYTVTDGTCSASDDVTITVDDKPNVDAGTYGPVCEDGDPIALLGTPAGGTWTGTGVTGNTTDGFFFDPSAGTQTLTYTVTDGACSGSDQVTITVDDKPNVDAGTYGPVCEDGDPIALLGTPAGGTWTGTGVTGNTTDGFFFDPSAGTQTLTYTVTDGACSGSDQVTITVDDKPNVDAGTYGPVCEDAGPIALAGTPAGGTWTGTGVSGNTTDGFFFDPSAGTQTLTYTVTDGTCSGSDNVTITVNDKPTVDAGTYGPVCRDAANVTLVGTPSGGTWSGTGVSGNTFDPSVGTQTLTYTIGGDCGGSDQVTIVVEECEVFQGCTPGYWKNHPSAFCAFAMNSYLFNNAFANPPGTTMRVFPGITNFRGVPTHLTFIQGLNLNGGGYKALIRAALAAIQNSCHSNVNYPYTMEEIIAAVTSAFNTGSAVLDGVTYTAEGLKNELDRANNLGCPLNRQNFRSSTIISPSEVDNAPTTVISKLNVSAFPNPYTDVVRFVIQTPVSGEATLQISNALGQKIATVYKGRLNANTSQIIEYRIPTPAPQAVIYTLTIGNERVVGRLIKANK